MPDESKKISPLTLGAATVLGADALVTTTLGSAIAPSSWTGPMAGLIFAAHFAGLCLAIVRSERMAAARGRHRFLSMAAATVVVATLLLPLLPLFLVWVVLRFLAGAGVGGVLHVGGEWLADRGVPTKSGRLLGFAAVTQLCAAAIQPLLAVYGPGHVETFVLAGALLVTGVGMMAGSRDARPATVGEAREPRAKALGALGIFAAGGAFGAGAAMASLLCFGPIWAYGIGMDVAATGLFMALLFAGGLAPLLMNRVLQRLDPRIALAIVAWALALVSVGFAFSAARSFLLAAPLALVSGALAFGLLPIAWAHADARGEADPHTVARSTALLCALGGVGGSLFTSLMMLPSLLGPAGLALGLGLTATAVAGLAVFHRVTRAGEGSEPIPLRPVPLPAALGAELVLRTQASPVGSVPQPLPPIPVPPPPEPPQPPPEPPSSTEAPTAHAIPEPSSPPAEDPTSTIVDPPPPPGDAG